MDRSECLEAARVAVIERGRSYGAPEDNFTRVSRLWNAHLANRSLLNGELMAGDVTIMLGLLKDARLAGDMANVDSWVDKAGYAACGAEVSTRVDRVEKEENCAEIPAWKAARVGDKVRIAPESAIFPGEIVEVVYCDPDASKLHLQCLSARRDASVSRVAWVRDIHVLEIVERAP